jgi:hypothetical protein
MCAGTSCAACNVDDLDFPCEHNADQRHLGLRSERDVSARTSTGEQIEGRVPTTPLPGPFLADRIDVNPADPESLAHFLETWAQIVRTRRCFSIILQPTRCPE